MKKLLPLGIILLALSLLLFSIPANSKQVIALTQENTVLLHGPVTFESSRGVLAEMRIKDKNMLKGEPMYLILNTPGGSVLDGMDIVSLAQSFDRPVHTITYFAASMGFVIAQHLGTRYILQNGILMSHRMKTGAQGEVGGELDEALAFARAISREINLVCAERMSMEVEDYEKRVSDEWWLYGQHAVNNKAADEVITVSCTDGLIQEGKCPF
jgi:ATP-dependent protease ClpP protease subunit